MEAKRIGLFDIISQDKNKITVAEITSLFCGLLNTYFSKTKTGANVKNKLTDDEYVSFVTGFANSFLSSLYVTAAKNTNEQSKRIETVSSANKDVFVSMEEIKK